VVAAVGAGAHLIREALRRQRDGVADAHAARQSVHVRVQCVVAVVPQQAQTLSHQGLVLNPCGFLAVEASHRLGARLPVGGLLVLLLRV
jgi:hypothetical protein